MMKFLVKQQKIEALEREVIASDQIAFVSVKFVFDEWMKGGNGGSPKAYKAFLNSS